MSEEDNLAESDDEEILGDTVQDAGSVKSGRRVIAVVEGRIRRSSQTIYRFASCGHIIRQASDLGGRCGEKGCTAIACSACTRVCSRCLKTICPSHTKMHNDRPYCSFCKWMVMLGFSQAQLEEY